MSRPLPSQILLTAALALAPAPALAQSTPDAPAAASASIPSPPPVISLSDQFDTPHTLRFPHTNVVVLTLADQKGSKQVEGWVRPLQARFPEHLTLAGVADVSKVPAFLRGRVRAGFREQMTYPVLLDWKGTVSRDFRHERGRVNVLLFDRSGTLQRRLGGEATPEALQSLTADIERVLPSSAVVADLPGEGNQEPGTRVP